MIGETTARSRREESVDVGAELSLLVHLDNAGAVGGAFCSHEAAYIATRVAARVGAARYPHDDRVARAGKGISRTHACRRSDLARRADKLVRVRSAQRQSLRSSTCGGSAPTRRGDRGLLGFVERDRLVQPGELEDVAVVVVQTAGE